ncbi:MAG: hypothetical protein NXI31_14585 [bacterium]|nr:hypothetical protein [bacterium]
MDRSPDGSDWLDESLREFDMNSAKILQELLGEPVAKPPSHKQHLHATTVSPIATKQQQIQRGIEKVESHLVTPKFEELGSI